MNTLFFHSNRIKLKKDYKTANSNNFSDYSSGNSVQYFTEDIQSDIGVTH